MKKWKEYVKKETGAEGLNGKIPRPAKTENNSTCKKKTGKKSGCVAMVWSPENFGLRTRMRYYSYAYV